MKNVLCMLGMHRWHKGHVVSIRYGALVTRVCVRCGAERMEARW